MTRAQIARAVDLSERRVREIFQFGTARGTIIEVPEAKTESELSPEILPMLEFSGDGFERFYERFSGMTLPAHSSLSGSQSGSSAGTGTNVSCWSL
jgi:hypothetical protein